MSAVIIQKKESIDTSVSGGSYILNNLPYPNKRFLNGEVLPCAPLRYSPPSPPPPILETLSIKYNLR